MKMHLWHQSTGKAYTFLSLTARLAARFYFQRIYLWNKGGVPSDRPVLLAANHPTAFMDPYLLCTLLDPPIYNMTRGDIFRKPLFRKMMEAINMFPVYRRRDGYSGRDRNNEVFEYCSARLKERRVIAIYVEGEHHLEKRLRPVQKGIAHIAFQAFAEQGLDDLQVVPAGCNYRFGDRPRDTVMIQIGQPIYVRDYWEAYLENPEQARQQLCADIAQALRQECLDIQDPKDDSLAEQVLTVHRSEQAEPLLPAVSHRGDVFRGEWALVQALNGMEGLEKAALRNRLEAYFADLRRAGLEDAGLVRGGRGHWAWALFFVGGFALFIVGGLASWPVRALTQWITRKKVRKAEYVSSVQIGVGHLSGMILFFLLLTLAVVTMEALWISLVMALPLVVWFYVLYRETWSRWRAARRALRHPRRAALLQQRAEIMQAIRALAGG